MADEIFFCTNPAPRGRIVGRMLEEVGRQRIGARPAAARARAIDEAIRPVATPR